MPINTCCGNPRHTNTLCCAWIPPSSIVNSVSPTTSSGMLLAPRTGFLGSSSLLILVLIQWNMSSLIIVTSAPVSSKAWDRTPLTRHGINAPFELSGGVTSGCAPPVSSFPGRDELDEDNFG